MHYNYINSLFDWVSFQFIVNNVTTFVIALKCFIYLKYFYDLDSFAFVLLQ